MLKREELGGGDEKWDGMFLVERGGEAGCHGCLLGPRGPNILPVAIGGPAAQLLDITLRTASCSSGRGSTRSQRMECEWGRMYPR